MKDKVKQLAEEAGFILWNNEEWKPEGQVVDWSSDYDKELKKFAELIVRECAGVAGCNGHVSGFALGDLLRQHFGVEE